MITYGVTLQGFVPKPLEVIKDELDARFKGFIGASAGTEPDGSIPARSLAGQIIGVMTDGLAAQWDQQQAIVASFDPNAATAAAQDALCAQTGTVRDPAVKSQVTATCTGTPGTPLQPGRAATVQGTGARFVSDAAAVIAAVAAWATATAYVAGDRRTANGRVYQCTIGGVSAGAGPGPAGTGTAIVDGTVTWRYLGEGTGAVDVLFLAADVGPFGALSGTLTEIATPVSGWQTVGNLLDADVGALLESDAALRIRREIELAADGLAAVDAIRAHVQRVGRGTANAVQAVRVFKNDSDVPDADGRPGHSVEVLVLGGLDADIALAIWEAVGGGIATFRDPGANGRTTVVTDSMGVPQTVYWSRPVAVPVYIVTTVLYDQSAGVFPANGSDQIKGALKTFGDTYEIGRDVRASALISAVFDGPVSTVAGAEPCPGILDVSPLYLGTAPAPGTSNPITITSRQLATFDTSRITVTLVGGTP